jgi:hypothetical protein
MPSGERRARGDPGPSAWIIQGDGVAPGAAKRMRVQRRRSRAMEGEGTAAPERTDMYRSAAKVPAATEMRAAKMSAAKVRTASTEMAAAEMAAAEMRVASTEMATSMTAAVTTTATMAAASRDGISGRRKRGRQNNDSNPDSEF